MVPSSHKKYVKDDSLLAREEWERERESKSYIWMNRWMLHNEEERSGGGWEEVGKKFNSPLGILSETFIKIKCFYEGEQERKREI